ncbi:MAG: phytoene/squalene synthase family protein [Bacteroidales bacterium]|nr:phytoene/squalene synthase family protein [Bacteroidales bacterium]
MDLYAEVSFATSKIITQKYSTSFSVAVSVLPPEMRRAIYSIYGFVRLADEIVDTFHSINQELILTNFEKDFYETLTNGISMNPVLHSFAMTVHTYSIPTHLVDSFFKSMKTDLNKQIYKSHSELNEYIYGSADVVGLMCLMVFVNGDNQLFTELQKPAMKLGSAFQKVNFLRDLKSDIEELDRTYFPQFEVNSFSDGVKSDLIKEIEIEFKEAKKGILCLPGKSKLAVYIAYVYYSELLRNLKATPAEQIMEKRIRVSSSTKLMLLCKAYVEYQLNMIK